MSRLSDRQAEIAFGLGLLVPVALILGLAEGAFRLYEYLRFAGPGGHEVAFDWGDLIGDVGISEPVGIGEGTYVRFRPNSQWGQMSFNDRGFRGPTLPVPAPTGMVRIAFLGDSKVLSVDLPEAETLAAQTTARLEALRPECRFDYVAMTGPGYEMDALAALWTAHAPTLRPDLAVVLAGTVVEMITRHDAAARPEDRVLPAQAVGSVTARDGFGLARVDVAEWSTLVRLAQRDLTLAPSTTRDITSQDLPWDALRIAYKDMAAELVRAMPDVPVLAIGYRSRLRAGQDAASLVENSQYVRGQVPGLSVEAATTLSEFVPEQLRDVAADAGWEFIDPLAAMPSDDATFVDATHLSKTGLARLADALVAQIAPAVDEACRL